jgi:ATP-dependent Clp protease ATP-binding subunit ClpC
MPGFNFTEDVRMVLAAAREESLRLNHEYVGTEHILLGFTVPGNEFTANLFRRIGADPGAIRATIEDVVHRGNAGQPPRTELPYTSRAKKALELAMVEATELKHSFVGSEHLLLGLIREERGIAAQVLKDHGVRGDRIRAALLERHPAESATPQPHFASRVVTPGSRFALGDGSIFVLTLVWIALWVYFRPDILNWRLVALMLIVVVPPLLLFRYARRSRR